MSKKILISVIGASNPTNEQLKIAEDVGRIVAKSGATLVCGGLDGLMRASCKGAKEAGGETIGIIPGKDKSDANEFVDYVIVTTIGFARNAIVAATGDIVVALPGSHGTSCEISYAFVYKKPIIDFGGWNREGMLSAGSIEEVNQHITKLINEI